MDLKQLARQRARQTDSRGQPGWGLSSTTLEHYARAVFANDATARAYESVCQSFAAAPAAVALTAGGLEPGGPLMGESLIVGVGLGAPPEADALTGPPGNGCMHLYTLEPISDREAVANAAAVFAAEALFEAGVNVRAIHTGPVDAYAHRQRWRPLHSGGSVAHFRVTAGTLGCHAKRDDGLPLILSNNHVLADVNAAQIGDDILQPSPFDGGLLPSDLAGALEDRVLIDFVNPNSVDCATALIDPADVSREFLYTQGGTTRFYRVSPQTQLATVGQRVGKSGRTTGLTSGTVNAVGVSVNVNMGSGRVARFVDQIAITGTRGNFSQPGDSGSLIWSWDSIRRPVGLLFAGGGGTTFANPIDTVLNSLAIRLAV